MSRSRKSIPMDETLPTPKAIEFKPGALLGSVSGELGLRKYLESNGHQLVVTSSKDGADSVLDKELPDAEIVILQPFWLAYMTVERIAKMKKLKMIVTAGIGSDHIDLQAAIENNITVAEVTYCNSNAVAEHVVMSILALVRNFIPSHHIILNGGWNIADAVSRSYDPRNAGSPGGSMNMSSRKSKGGSTQIQMPCGRGESRLSAPSARSRPAWAQPTS